MVEFLHGEIKDILPHNLLTPEIYSVSYAVGEAMRCWGRFCASLHLYAEISCVPEVVLDLMAIEMNTQYYDQSMNRKMKEQLVMQSLVWHLRAGTPSVLNEFLATVLGGGYIEEWMEYDGEPYHFRAYAKVDEGMEVPLGYVTEIKRQLNTYKNVRFLPDDADCGNRNDRSKQPAGAIHRVLCKEQQSLSIAGWELGSGRLLLSEWI